MLILPNICSYFDLFFDILIYSNHEVRSQSPNVHRAQENSTSDDDDDDDDEDEEWSSSSSCLVLPLGLPITGSNIKGCLIFVRIIICFDIRIIFESRSSKSKP